MNYEELMSLEYDLIRGNRWGRLKKSVTIQTGVLGYQAEIDEARLRVRLYKDGDLWIGSDTEWNFGNKPAINTPEMIRASLPHDMFAHLTEKNSVPYSVRKEGDRVFREVLQRFSPERSAFNPRRYWPWVRWAGVSIYSQTMARFAAWRNQRKNSA